MGEEGERTAEENRAWGVCWVWMSKVSRAPGVRGVGEKWEFGTTRTLGRVVGPHLGAVRTQVGMGVLEPGDGTVTQAPSDRHQCVEILQLAETLGRAMQM